RQGDVRSVRVARSGDPATTRTSTTGASSENPTLPDSGKRRHLLFANGFERMASAFQKFLEDNHFHVPSAVRNHDESFGIVGCILRNRVRPLRAAQVRD